MIIADPIIVFASEVIVLNDVYVPWAREFLRI